MPSPFPGMDPWLEDPAIFPDLHDSLIVYAREYLQARLPRPYFTAINSYVWLDEPERYVQPDANVLRGPGQNGGAGAAGGDLLTEPVVIHIPGEQQRLTYLEIRALYENERLVTSIEVLSWANKSPGRRARSMFRRKQEQIISGQANVVEIDLLRGGNHATAVPRDELVARTGGSEYHISVRRFDNPDDYLVYPIRLMDRLPRFGVPLLPNDGVVPLDVQAIFDRAYDAGPYRHQIHYDRREPVPALSAEQAAWAITILRERGLLKNGSPQPTES